MTNCAFDGKPPADGKFCKYPAWNLIGTGLRLKAILGGKVAILAAMGYYVISNQVADVTSKLKGQVIVKLNT